MDLRLSDVALSRPPGAVILWPDEPDIQPRPANASA